MTKLGDLYTDFSRIDLDLRGGYARVAQAKTRGRQDYPEYCAFKLMRHELVSMEGGRKRFEGELRTLLDFTADKNCPPAITKIYDSGFVSVKLSKALKQPDNLIENFKTIEAIDPKIEIISTSLDYQAYLVLSSELEKSEPGHWLPYLAVELATYEDNLLRQIRRLGHTDKLDKLPVKEIIAMTIQLIDLLEYIYSEHKSAYMDWKPEHIFWNGASRQAKLIDWNVTNRFNLNNESELKRLVREDIRLFCGAALYCSLALNDPEDLERPIGPEPTSLTDSTSFIHRRYWTDNPNLYERGSVLDNKIKEIVKKGLNPNHGFNSPQDLKVEILEYAKQYLGLSEAYFSVNTPAKKEGGLPRTISSQNSQVDAKEILTAADDAYFASEYNRAISLYLEVLRLEPQNTRAANHLLIAKSIQAQDENLKALPPRDAIQLYRRARSYISAGDFQDAKDALTSAVNISREKGVRYPDAEQLLKSVEDRLAADDYKNKATLAVKAKNWNVALNLYYQALTRDPTNTITSQETFGIQSILQTKSDELQKKGVLNLFGNLSKLRIVTKAAKNISNYDGPVIKNLEKQINQISLLRSAITTILIVSIFIAFYFTGIPSSFYAGFALTNTPTTELTFRPLVATKGLTTETFAPATPTRLTKTATITIAPTDTLTPTSTEVTLGIGYINKMVMSVWKEPNKNKIATLSLNQSLILLEQKIVSGSTWYRCRWELDNTTSEGWILGEYINFGIPPTPGS